MTIRIHSWRSLILLAAWPLSALAASSHISLPGGDELWLTIPATWNQKFESPDKNTPPSVWLTARQGSSFNVLMTPLTGSPVSAAMTDENKLRGEGTVCEIP
jgi:hypothetical protein